MLKSPQQERCFWGNLNSAEASCIRSVLKRQRKTCASCQRGKSGLIGVAQFSRNCCFYQTSASHPPTPPTTPAQDWLAQQELILNIQGRWISENLRSCRKDERTEAQRMKWLPEGHIASLESSPRKKDSTHKFFIAPWFVCTSDAVFLLTKGPEVIRLPRGALLITEEHKVKARPESGKIHCQKGNSQDLRLD